MEHITIPYTPLPYQKELHYDPHRFRTVVAGRRVGKTTFAINELLRLAIKRNVKAPYWYVAPYYNQAKTIAWEMLLKYCPRALMAKPPNVNELSISLITGDKIVLKGADNPSSLEGIGLGAVIADEIQTMSQWRTLWENTLRPMLSDYESPAIFIGRPSGFNHFHTLAKMGDHQGIIEGEATEDVHLDPDFITYRFETEQNCREHQGGFIAHSEIDAARRHLTEAAFNQEYRARFEKYTGLVYKEFDRAVHVRDLPDFRPVFYIRGLDRGFRNPTALALVAVDADGIWYQQDELYATGLTNPALEERIRGLSDAKVFDLSTMDSASASDIQELNDLGLDFLGVKKESGESGKSYVRWKVQKLAERLKVRDDGKPGYYVHPGCTNTIREFETYQWPERQDDTKAHDENPLKLNDHMMDALADLNAMYMHTYEPAKTHPWDGKVPGTFIPPSPVVEEEENDWNAGAREQWWEDGG